MLQFLGDSKWVNGWILPNGGVALGKVCACSLRSRLAFIFTSNLKEIYVFCYLLYPGTWPSIDKGSVDKCTVVGADNSHLFPIFVSRVMTLTFSFSHN